MKTLIVLAVLLSTSACEVLVPAALGGATALSLEANHKSVSDFGDKAFKAE